MQKRQTVLVVNDKLQFREFIRSMLQDKYEIITASGIEDAFKCMTDYAVNLVLLDVKVARLDGITVLREMKKHYPETEVILITAYASLETIREAFKLGAFGFLMKPFDIDRFVDTVDEALKMKH